MEVSDLTAGVLVFAGHTVGFQPEYSEFTMALNCSRISWGKITGFLGRPVIMGFLLFFSYTP
jgi:hypothetical protein